MAPPAASRVWQIQRKSSVWGPKRIGWPTEAGSNGLWPPAFTRLPPTKATSANAYSLRSIPMRSITTTLGRRGLFFYLRQGHGIATRALEDGCTQPQPGPDLSAQQSAPDGCRTHKPSVGDRKNLLFSFVGTAGHPYRRIRRKVKFLLELFSSRFERIAGG
jgi:hypothetical protein